MDLITARTRPTAKAEPVKKERGITTSLLTGAASASIGMGVYQILEGGDHFTIALYFWFAAFIYGLVFTTRS